MKVLLVDDHHLFREGVALLLRPLSPDLEIFEAATCEEGLARLDGGLVVDLALVDLAMPGMGGMAGIRLMRERHVGTPVVALSSSDDKASVLEVLDAGAMGFIPKSSSSAILLGALQLILARGIYLPPSVFFPEAATAPSTIRARQTADPAAGLRPLDLGLSNRQAQVLYQILQGKPAKVICRDLKLTASTVKAHTSAVLRALNVTTRTQAVVAAGRLGLRFDDPGQPQ